MIYLVTKIQPSLLVGGSVCIKYLCLNKHTNIQKYHSQFIIVAVKCPKIFSLTQTQKKYYLTDYNSSLGWSLGGSSRNLLKPATVRSPLKSTISFVPFLNSLIVGKP